MQTLLKCLDGAPLVRHKISSGSNLPGRRLVPGVMRGGDDDGAGVTVVTAAVVTPAVVTPVTPRGGPQGGPGLAVRPLVTPRRDRRARQPGVPSALAVVQRGQDVVPMKGLSVRDQIAAYKKF